ncbi:hypothetical protein BO82DRAFT_358855 [Aspergillus uvarum CBS 121591]|uniref:Uncharacterized protein n=1 Tax=Aspergillus uvarum CBS 121591 TaxID=1448315 RepID=A0A319BVQ8_9EURO|nr:hypothetical protein BO82DRAFT_358855 [Aspergillus uvarum CBS 121591]PYH76714.1 hypothetical protein BO82DRAFT_358855 [Aspergillus uvarum CBS 121591]
MHSTASAHTSPVKDGRRILGEKTANACLSPARPRHAASLSPAKRPFLEAPSFTSPSKKLLPSPLFAGQKRTIDQVEGPHEHESNTRERAPAAAAAAAPIHAQEELPTESSAIAADEQIPSDATQQPSIPDLETQQQPQQQPCKSTQPSTQQPPPPSTRAVLSDPATRKSFIHEKATLLRTRLQTAMRHVRDPQFDRRLSELEAHSRKCPRLVVAETSGSYTPAPTRMGGGGAATADPKTPVPFVSASNLQPERNASLEKHASGLSSPPLSTGNEAASASALEEEEEDGEDAMKTPTQKMYRQTGGTGKEASPMQLSSPPATVSRRRIGAGPGTGTGLEESDGEEDGIGMGMGMGFPETQRRLSQKGDAVDGLLKLMGTAEHSGKEARTG